MSAPKRLSDLHQYYPSLFTSGCKAKAPVTGMHKKYNLGLVFILHEDLEPEASSYSGELTITRVGNAIKFLPELMKFRGVRSSISTLPGASIKEQIFNLNELMKKSHIKNCTKRFDVGEIIYFDSITTSQHLNTGQTYKAEIDRIEKYPDDESKAYEAYYRLKLLKFSGEPMLDKGQPIFVLKLDKEMSR